MNWRSGTFEKQKLSPVLHAFTPAHAVDNLFEIDLDDLWDRGKRLLLLDVDNTIVQWHQEDFSEPVVAWIDRAKHMGFSICLVSNTKRVDRLNRLRTRLGVEMVRGRFKPSRDMYRSAMAQFNVAPDQTIMVGDQLMTDILGANRAGLEAYWVRKMEGAEFKGTSMVNRRIERVFQSFIYRAIVAPMDESQTEDAQKPLPEKSIVHQIVKFCIVGGTSFIIDFVIFRIVMLVLTANGVLMSESGGAWLRQHLSPLFGFAETNQDAFVPIAATISASVAILNSFVWNRFWTFEIRGTEERFRQLQRFVAVSVVGLALNVVLRSIFNHLLPFSLSTNLNIATFLAAGFVAIWNFTGQRYFAFRVRPS